jgi:penicillin-binding protein 2
MKIMKKRLRFKKRNREIDPDEIFIDSENVSDFDTNQFEGRIEKPISKLSMAGVGVFFALVLFVFVSRLSILQVAHGTEYKTLSENNTLRSTPIFAARGVIYDRNGVELAWNAPAAPATQASASATSTAASTTPLMATAATSTANTDASGEEVPTREYTDLPGLSHTLGYVQYPSKDSSGFYYQEDFEGVAGAEKYLNDFLTGTNGLNLIQVDAHEKVQSENTIRPPKEGQSVTLSVDAKVQSELYSAISDVANQSGFTGGVGIIMDVHTGEIIADTSYPEYSSEAMSSKTDATLLQSYFNDPNHPFLDRVTQGLYVPGSIIKPYMALAALNENIISPTTIIQGTKYIAVQNPYDPTKQTIFNDWQAQGPEDMYKAIAMSSDVYFYEIGGGYKDQKGLGINLIDKYIPMFGFGTPVGNTGDNSPDTDTLGSFFTSASGTIPSPAWKAATFDGEGWYLGDTYHTAIGQYGYQVTPIQVVRAVASLANGGTVLNPTIIKGDQGTIAATVNIPQADFAVVRQGMREGAQTGVVSALNLPFVAVAAKSGTAQLGVNLQYVNSWITGFWPYDNPKYAFALLLEKGPSTEVVNATAAMVEAFKWMNINTPQYFQ